MGNPTDGRTAGEDSVPESQRLATSQVARSERAKTARPPSIPKFTLFILCNILVANLAIWAGDRLLAKNSANPQAYRGLASTSLVLTWRQGNDSLGVMLPLIRAFERDSKVPIYESVFFEQHAKFQYPLTSLLPLYGLVRLGTSDSAISRLFKGITLLGAGLTIFLCFRLALRLLGRNGQQVIRTHDKWILAATFTVGALFYYPLMSSLSLGQIQALLTLGFTVAFLCWISGREVAASVVIGLMTAVKPQYGLFFVWALARRKFGAAAAGIGCLGVFGALSVAVFGWHNNIEYLQVLRYIAPRGEGYFENQSMNGVLNRLLFNGNNMIWDGNHFAPRNSIVYLGTTITSALLLALAFFYPWGKDRRGGATDFACMILTSTMASPIAWVHHYAILLPILVWLWFGDVNYRTSKWATGAIAVAYILMSDRFTTADALAPVPFWNLLQSTFYFAAILVLILLLKSHSEAAESRLSPALPKTAP